MRFALALPLLLATSPALAQRAGARCAPRVEANAAVPPALVARLTAAVSSGAMAAPVQCPLVRFDVVGAHLVMTAVLDDGRQVARVLASQSDALPTLVALMATPPMPDESAPEAPPAPAAPPAPPAAPIALPTPALRAAPATPATARWGLRLGASLGVGRVDHTGSLRATVDVEVLRGRWAFGARAAYERAGRRGEAPAGAAATISTRHRWVAGRWELDAGPALGLRWSESPGGGVVTARVGAEASAALRLGAAWSVFARLDGGADFALTGRPPEARQRRDDDDATLAWGAAVGLRWDVLR
jgi:hypothetical protein